jgi:hypothetical protein
LKIKSNIFNKKWRTCFGLLFLIVLLGNFTVVKAAVINDAYTYQDDFSNSNGIDLGGTTGFINTGGAMLATQQIARVSSNCFSLPQPIGGTFQEWSFLDVEVADLGDVTTNTFEVRDCLDNVLQTETLAEGINSIDISSIPNTNTNIKLVFQAEHTGVPGAGVTGVSLNEWEVYGKADGVTILNIQPTQSEIDSNSTITFNIEIGSTGAVTPNGVLTVSLDDINGDGINPGLAEDATVCYDVNNNGVVENTAEECRMYRPLEFQDAANGPNGEIPTMPAVGATTGTVSWDLNDILDGYSGSTSVTFTVSKGYVDGKTLKARVKLEYGTVGNSGSVDNVQTIVKDSGEVVVNSALSKKINRYSALSNFGPGAEDAWDYFSVFNDLGSQENSSDFENITITIHAGNSTCIPTYDSKLINIANNYPYTIIQKPVAGSIFDESNPFIIKFHRISNTPLWHQASQTRIFYDVPLSCQNGDQIIHEAEAVDDSSWLQTTSITHNIIIEVCRRVYWYLERLMSGFRMGNNYNGWPGNYDFYIHEGSVFPGEYLFYYLYGNSSNRTHTVTLDHSYTLTTIPDGLTFHGVKGFSWLSNVYKDSTGTALVPNDPAFDHNNPINSGWKLVDVTWDGPFTNNVDDNDSRAVVNSGSRILTVKDDDNPSTQAPDYGQFSSNLIFRVCDGSFGCLQESEGTVIRMQGVFSKTYTYQTIQQPYARVCYTNSGYLGYLEDRSWPKVYTWSEVNQVKSGEIAQIIINPHNHNKASQYTDGRWVVNLFNIRNSIDLNNVTGEVLTAGLNIPYDDQNIEGESCNVNNIVFHAPNGTNCLAAVDSNDPACMAWWEVPEACQLPNGWGYRDVTTDNQDEYIRSYQFRLNAPIKPTVSAGTTLTFTSEVRTIDLTQLGADNAVDIARWGAGNYTATTDITVLSLPAVDVSKTGPAIWPDDSTFTYNTEVENEGNGPNNGIYLVDKLPKAGDSFGSDFTPEYQKVYLNLAAADGIVEYSTEGTCVADPIGGTWTDIPLQATGRSGYQSETSNNLDANTTCVRIRIDPGSSMQLNPGESILGAIDIHIPNGTAEGLNLYNKALAGSNAAWNGLNLSPVETTLVQTQVGQSVVLDIEKEHEIDPTREGWIKWRIKYANKSATPVTNTTIEDTLPNELIYEGIIDPLDPHESCNPSECTIINSNPDGTGGSLSYTIAVLEGDDGDPNGGLDQGELTFWTRITEGIGQGVTIENCSVIIPDGAGQGDTACHSFQTGSITIDKSQTVEPDIGGEPAEVERGIGRINYTIIAVNNEASGVYFNIYDVIPEEGTYIPGTLKINGATAADDFITEGILNYQFVTETDPGDTVTIEYGIDVRSDIEANQLIENSAYISFCLDNMDLTTCLPAQETNIVEAKVINIPPVAEEDYGVTDYKTEITIQVVDNDTDDDDGLDISSLRITVEPEHGTARVEDGAIIFIPEFGYVGLDALTYEICDQAGDCTTAKVNLTIDKTIKEVSIEKPEYTVNEPDGEVKVRIVLSEPSDEAITVKYKTNNVTAEKDKDYLTNGTLTFDPGEEAKEVAIPIVDDKIEEDTEAFRFSILEPVSAVLGQIVSTKIIIYDDDQAGGTEVEPVEPTEPVVGPSPIVTEEDDEEDEDDDDDDEDDDDDDDLEETGVSVLWYIGLGLMIVSLGLGIKMGNKTKKDKKDEKKDERS